MTTAIGWIDFSPVAKERVKAFLDMIGTGGVVDELGIGTTRDSLSDLLYPGLSTLYTRAKYLFITPYILQDREIDRKNRKNLGRKYFNKKEEEANKAIIDFYKENPSLENESYFGKNAGAHLRRQPSVIYWSGIKHFKLISTNESLDQLLFDRRSTVSELLMSINEDSNSVTTEDGEYNEKRKVNVQYDPKWMVRLHTNGAHLTRGEAETLYDRITTIDKNSLISALLTNDRLWKTYRNTNPPKSELTNNFTDFAYHAIKGNMIDNSELKTNLTRAYDLAIFLYGQHAVYNLALRKIHGEKEWEEYYRKLCKDWYNCYANLMLDFTGFSIETYFLQSNVRQHTRNFLQEQQDLVFSKRSWEDIEDEYIRIVTAQEKWNKRKKSRFYKISREEDVKELNDGKWIGLQLIPYRFDSGKRIINDIRTAL